MSIKNLTLACVAAFAIVMPARADVILGYRIGLPPSGNMPDPTWIDSEVDPINNTNIPPVLGPAITSPLLMSPGQTMFLQVTMRANATALSSPTPSFPQSAWTTANRLNAFSMNFNYTVGVVTNPFALPIPPVNTDQNNANAIAAVPFGTSPLASYPFFNQGGTSLRGDAFFGSLAANAGIVNERVIAIFRIVAEQTTTPLAGAITLSDASSIHAGFRLQSGQNLDEFVFHPSHNNYPLFVNVNPVPEPSSVALAGVALFGMGWRKWRRQRSTRP